MADSTYERIGRAFFMIWSTSPPTLVNEFMAAIEAGQGIARRVDLAAAQGQPLSTKPERCFFTPKSVADALERMLARGEA